MKKILCCLLFLFGCANTKPADTDDTVLLTELKLELETTYKLKTLENAYAWPSETDCDGALWAGEARASGLSQVVISAALQSDGRPTRRPMKDCLAGESDATTSTDMRLGTILGLYAAGDRTSLELFRDYANSHSNLMGTPRVKFALVYMKPQERYFLSQAIAATGGSNDEWGYARPPYLKPTTDSDVHLQLLQIYMQKKMNIANAWTDIAARGLCSDWPNDALAQALCNQKELAGDLLLSKGWKVPSYVRGSDNYELVYKLFVLHLLLESDGVE